MENTENRRTPNCEKKEGGLADTVHHDISSLAIMAALADIRKQLARQDDNINKINTYLSGGLGETNGVDDTLLEMRRVNEDFEARLRALEVAFARLVNPRFKTLVTWIAAVSTGFFVAAYTIVKFLTDPIIETIKSWVEKL